MQREFSVLHIAVGVVAMVALLFLGLQVWDSVKLKHRDSTRLNHMKEYAKALELFHTRAGHYPRFPNGVKITGSDSLSQELKSELLFKQIPLDPLFPEFSYTYRSRSSATTYVITFCMETNQFEGYHKGCDNTYTP